MNKYKKTISLLLAVLMTISFSIPVLAFDDFDLDLEILDDCENHAFCGGDIEFDDPVNEMEWGCLISILGFHKWRTYKHCSHCGRMLERCENTNSKGGRCWRTRYK